MYIANIKNTECTLVSPGLMSDNTLLQLPKVHIDIGSEDPLRSDCLKFADRMLANNKKITMTIYKNLPHGFLHFEKLEKYNEIVSNIGNNICGLFNN